MGIQGTVGQNAFPKRCWYVKVWAVLIIGYGAGNPVEDY